MAADYKEQFNRAQKQKKTVYGTGCNSRSERSIMNEASEATDNSKIEQNFGIKRRFDQSADMTMKTKGSHKSSDSSSSGGVFIDPPKHLEHDEDRMQSLKGNQQSLSQSEGGQNSQIIYGG